MATVRAERTANRLAQANSPYLLQHAHNPVDWHMWGAEAFDRARGEEKPIFLSVGYSTCHWCHVMERESFEDDEVARLMNEHFVNIKLDREERPDVDRVYMSFVQATTGSGGWPLSVWLTPDLKPFFGGTYFPPTDLYGRPGFSTVLRRIAEAWAEERDRIVSASEQTVQMLRQALTRAPTEDTLDEELVNSAFESFAVLFDARRGGFGSAPKFPRPVVFNFLLRVHAQFQKPHALHMVLETLRQMARGGLHDHLGGGFHRYSVDGEWHVPHFEKMLYDQAQLIVSYLEAYQLTGEPGFAETARGTCEYVLRDLTCPETGGFFSAEDADSPSPEDPQTSREGAYYIWRYAELEALLGDDLELACAHYGLKKAGNATDPHGELTGTNVLHVVSSEKELAEARGVERWDVARRLASIRDRLRRARQARPRPARDDKIITSWNGLMIGAFARAYQVLGEKRYLEAASGAADFCQNRLWRAEERRLYRRFRAGEGAIEGVLDDYAAMVDGLVALYDAELNAERLSWAEELAEQAVALFWDGDRGGFFASVEGDSSILLRLKDDHDGAEPSGNALMTRALLRLGRLTGRDDFCRRAEETIGGHVGALRQSPEAMPEMLAAAMLSRMPTIEVVIAGERGERDTDALLAAAWRPFVPNRTLLLADSPLRQLLGARLPHLVGALPAEDGSPRAFVCADRVCGPPLCDPQALSDALGEGAARGIDSDGGTAEGSP